MAHFEKHSTSIKALIDTTEAMLDAMEKYGVDPETVTKRNEFTVLIHFLKSIIDGELNIPNELTDIIREKGDQWLQQVDNVNKKLN
tara:strand:+ start:3783 stop:4040 length:258 start_codon:yes stop_codon:yes gene_type:complete